MEASGLIAAACRSRAASFLGDLFPWFRAPLVATTVCTATLLFTFSGLVAMRRFWGGLQSAPSLPALVAVAFMLAVLSSVVHCGTQLLCHKDSAAYRAAQGLLPLSLAIAVFSICLPSSSVFAILLIVVVLGSEELFWLVRPALLRDRTNRRPAKRQPDPVQIVVHENKQAAGKDFVADFSPEVIRRIERTRGPAGEDICRGQIRSEFFPGQRTAEIHLEFCPPFHTSPVLHIEQIEGPEALVKATQVLPYGARLEVRLARSGSERFETRIEFSAIVEAGEEA